MKAVLAPLSLALALSGCAANRVAAVCGQNGRGGHYRCCFLTRKREIWIDERSPECLAHELCHAAGLDDEYCEAFVHREDRKRETRHVYRSRHRETQPDAQP